MSSPPPFMNLRQQKLGPELAPCTISFQRAHDTTDRRVVQAQGWSDLGQAVLKLHEKASNPVHFAPLPFPWLCLVKLIVIWRRLYLKVLFFQ
jgi:hypothetical protein